MSKIKKLIKTPRLFFYDMLKKHVAQDEKKAKPKTPTKNVTSNSIANKINITINEKSTLITERARLYQPIRHLIHTGEGINCVYQIEQWIGEFLTSKESFAILVRNIPIFKHLIQKYPFINIIFAKNPSDVENALNGLPYLKYIYYTSNTGNLIHSLRYNIYEHIFLGHGDSDKAASAHKFFRVYDEVWVAGDAHIDSFKNAGFETKHIKFVKVGRPSLKEIIKNSIDKQNTSLPEILNLTYLPTWEGVFEENNYSSCHLSVVLLSEIQYKTNCKVNVKFHPLTGQRNKNLLEIHSSLLEEFSDRFEKLDISNKSTPVSDIIPKSDVFICDISAVVSECIASLAPIFIYIPQNKNFIISNSNMSYNDYCYTFSSIDELILKFNDVIINGNDTLKKARLDALDYLLSIEDTTNDSFIQRLKTTESSKSFAANVLDKVTQ